MSRDSAILLIVGEGDGNDELAGELALEGYEIRRAEDPLSLRARCVPGEVDLIILGPTTDQGASLVAVRALRAGEFAPQVGSGVRVLWVNETYELPEVLRAFEAGVDDVIGRPFVYAELLARVRALLRRDLQEERAVLRYGALEVNAMARQATFGLIPVDLCRQEYALLVHLARDPERDISKEELLRDVWGFRAYGKTRTVDSHACRLRGKLAAAGAEGFVTSVWGIGYRLAPAAHPQLRVLQGGRSA